MCRSCRDRKSTRLNSSHTVISYAVFCLKKKKSFRAHAYLVQCDERYDPQNDSILYFLLLDSKEPCLNSAYCINDVASQLFFVKYLNKGMPSVPAANFYFLLF